MEIQRELYNTIHNHYRLNNDEVKLIVLNREKYYKLIVFMASQLNPYPFDEKNIQFMGIRVISSSEVELIDVIY